MITSIVRRILLQIEYKRIPVHDLHITCNMYSRQWIITSDHDALRNPNHK
jgi:hypothetical protein